MSLRDKILALKRLCNGTKDQNSPPETLNEGNPNTKTKKTFKSNVTRLTESFMNPDSNFDNNSVTSEPVFSLVDRSSRSNSKKQKASLVPNIASKFDRYNTPMTEIEKMNLWIARHEHQDRAEDIFKVLDLETNNEESTEVRDICLFAIYKLYFHKQYLNEYWDGIKIENEKLLENLRSAGETIKQANDKIKQLELEKEILKDKLSKAESVISKADHAILEIQNYGLF